ncbi:MAG: D-tyrosyl-tRNA(Tyr) deacylase [Gammaproteobacteria bacterium]|nr:D-tyrosyl-tRNA(Tyr) deacylase [Gammaproteobacteria bacterium]MYI78285.1 D-tyrosyl-tRNA(Tyr) deacylase [Gammaproteobacteria bacterium]
MKALIQRVASASVLIAGEETASIGRGMLVFLGVLKGDAETDATWLANKVVNHRIFPDENTSMNESVQDAGGEVLVISQFTLAATSKKGNRPDFSQAEHPVRAEELYEHFVREMKRLHKRVETGVFGANMQVTLINDGPVTILISSS